MLDHLLRWLELVEQWLDRLDATGKLQPGQPLKRGTWLLLLMVFVLPILLLGWTWLISAQPLLEGWLMLGFSILFGVIGGSFLLLSRWLRWPYSRSRLMASPIWHGTTWWLISCYFIWLGSDYASQNGIPLWVFVAMFAWVTVIYLLKLLLELTRSRDAQRDPSMLGRTGL